MPAGGLVEIETEQTYLSVIAMVVIGGSIVAAFVAITAYGYPDWSEQLFLGVVGAVCVGVFVLGRLGNTMQLRLKH